MYRKARYAKKRPSLQKRKTAFAVTSPTRIAASGTTVLSVFRSLTDNWTLVVRMARRDIEARYRGSSLGIAWTVLVPLVMLAVYTFVFGFTLKVRWSARAAAAGVDNHAEFSIILFSGLILFWMFSDTIARAPGLVRENINYVTKIVFPIHILPWVAVMSGLFNLAVSIGILLVGQTLFIGLPPVTALLAPLVLAPLVLLILGVSWLFASVGMFVRDLQQVVNVLLSVTMFLSPVFYSLEAVPADIRWMFYLNPLTFIVEQFREVMLWGNAPNWTGLALYAVFSLAVAWLGLLWFQKTRKGFADVL